MLDTNGFPRPRTPAPSYGNSWGGLSQLGAAGLLEQAPLRHLKAGHALFSVGEACDGAYQIEAGVLKLSLMSPEGEECILAILSSGALVGDAELIDGSPRTSSAIALSDCTFRFVCKPTFEAFAAGHPEIYRSLSQVLARRLLEAQQSLAAHAFLNAQGRLAHALLTLAETVGNSNADEITIPRIISQRELAALAGVARENINRILRSWEERKLLSRLSNAYCIKDRAELQRQMQR